MKTDNPETGSLYQGKEKKPKRSLPARLPLLIIALVAAHFLNVFMNWTVMRRELEQKPSYRSPEYTFFGFSWFFREEIAAAQRLPNASPSGRVFAFFDFSRQAVFMVWNNGAEDDFFDLGPLLVALPAGASRVSFFPGSVFLLRHGEREVARNHGGSILGNAWAGFLSKKNAGAGGPGLGITGSFVVKQEDGAPNLKIPYLVYFLLPLVLIIILIASFGTAMAAAFIYYAGMFFLFDFQRLFVTVPLAPLFGALGVELAAPWIKMLAVALALLFLAAAIFGLLRWKNSEMPPSGKWIVWFFILLPFFLFF